MDNKQLSKQDMGKGLETFLIMSQLWFRSQPTQGSSYIPCRTSHLALIIFHDRGIIIILTQIFFVPRVSR